MDLKFWREDDEALAVSVDGEVTYYSADASIFEVAESMGLTRDDFEYLS